MRRMMPSACLALSLTALAWSPSAARATPRFELDRLDVSPAYTTSSTGRFVLQGAVQAADAPAPAGGARFAIDAIDAVCDASDVLFADGFE